MRWRSPYFKDKTNTSFQPFDDNCMNKELSKRSFTYEKRNEMLKKREEHPSSQLRIKNTISHAPTLNKQRFTI